jgi:hypothetical protein
MPWVGLSNRKERKVDQNASGTNLGPEQKFETAGLGNEIAIEDKSDLPAPIFIESDTESYDDLSIAKGGNRSVRVSSESKRSKKKKPSSSWFGDL